VLDVVITDPPYYDAIPYSDLMDFFYIWIRRAMWGTSAKMETVFSSPLSPKWSHEEGTASKVTTALDSVAAESRVNVTTKMGWPALFRAARNSLTTEDAW
jgi:adenine-specific DNA methylase